MRITMLAVAGVLAFSIAAIATPIPGANNEVINGGFEQGLDNWQYTPGEVAIDTSVGQVGHSLQCDLNTDGWGDEIRQVIDDSRGNLWNPNLHAKVVDLEAYIAIATKHEAVGGVRFRLDWWDESFNEFNEAPSDDVDGYHTSDWVEYTSAQGYGGSFTHVNPFNQVSIMSATGAPIQPRWISVEVEFLQPNNVINHVDSIELTSQCVPEPSALMAILAGLGSIGTLRAFKRK